MKPRQLFILLFIVTTLNCSQNYDHITDLIKPVILKESETTTVVLSDLFYSIDYNISFLPNENFDVNINKELNTVDIISLNNFSGMDLISFNLSDKTYQIPVKLGKKQKHSFSYVAEGLPERINLFGQFNGWNREDLPMSDEDGDGVYNITIPLDPGRYEYKFFVDGLELIDPVNPVKVPNGLGDFNSVIVIENPASYNNYLHLLNFTEDENYLSYNFYYEASSKELITFNDIVALIDNFRISSNALKLDDNKITLSINNNDLQGQHVLRVAVSKNGSATNFQTIRLNNGFPSDDNLLTWNDAIIYSIMIDRFSDGDSSNNNPVIHPELSIKANYNGGDLQGIINKLEEGYFDSVGINTIWISPVVDNTNKAYKEYPPPHRYYTGYHGYWPISATGVEEHFGDMQLLKNFVATAHKHNIMVLLDYVSHHIHEE
ncbi:MAG: alpha-amylase family glycosyl hydrolase, partial [Ignavibacteria bacterium]